MMQLPDDDPTPVEPPPVEDLEREAEVTSSVGPYQPTLDAYMDARTASPTFRERPPDPAGGEGLVALVFASRSGDLPHVVTRVPDSDLLSCTCRAALGLASRPRGCHAMVEARRLLGVPAI